MIIQVFFSWFYVFYTFNIKFLKTIKEFLKDISNATDPTLKQNTINIYIKTLSEDYWSFIKNDKLRHSWLEKDPESFFRHTTKEAPIFFLDKIYKMLQEYENTIYTSNIILFLLLIILVLCFFFIVIILFLLKAKISLELRSNNSRVRMVRRVYGQFKKYNKLFLFHLKSEQKRSRVKDRRK